MNPGTLSLIMSDPTPEKGNDDEFARLLQRLLSLINAWVRGQKGRVSEGYIVPEPEGLMLYVIGRQESYDFDLSRELSDFTLRVAAQGLELNTTLLPASSPDELTAFFDPRRGPAIRIPAE